MKVIKGLIVCEESQVVTKNFRKQGLEFKSCDLKPCSGGHPEWHYQEDAFQVLQRKHFGLSFLGAHPVCKYLANSGVRWLTSVKPKNGYEWSEKYQIYINKDRWEKMVDGALFFKSILSWVKTVGAGYVENPIMHKYAMEIIQEKPTQIIQPWMFGDTAKKATCMWIVGLPNLEPTNIVPKELRTDEIHKCPPGREREAIRSKTFPGIGEAFSVQWGNYLKQTI